MLIQIENVKKLMDIGYNLCKELVDLQELIQDVSILIFQVMVNMLLVSKELVIMEKFLFMLVNGTFVHQENQLKPIMEQLNVQMKLLIFVMLKNHVQIHVLLKVLVLSQNKVYHIVNVMRDIQVNHVRINDYDYKIN